MDSGAVSTLLPHFSSRSPQRSYDNWGSSSQRPGDRGERRDRMRPSAGARRAGRSNALERIGDDRVLLDVEDAVGPHGRSTSRGRVLLRSCTVLPAMDSHVPFEDDQVGDPGAGGRRARRRSLFQRGEDVLAHAVYGLILTMATVGELIHHEVSSGVAVAWLLGAGAVLLGAHLFSDVLAHASASGEDPHWRDVLAIGGEDLAVTYGAVGAAVVMSIAALANLDAEAALISCVALGLIAVAALSYHALSNHRFVVRAVVAGVAVLVGAVIVVLENTF